MHVVDGEASGSETKATPSFSISMLACTKGRSEEAYVSGSRQFGFCKALTSQEYLAAAVDYRRFYALMLDFKDCHSSVWSCQWMPWLTGIFQETSDRLFPVVCNVWFSAGKRIGRRAEMQDGRRNLTQWWNCLQLQDGS